MGALASGLRKLNLQSGDRVAIAALNSDWYLEWLLGVPCAGGIIAPLNYRWSVQEACDAMQQIKPTFLVVDQHCAVWVEEMKKTFPNLSIITLGCSLLEALDAESILELAEHTFQLFWAPNAIALICFTSGTTGRPKGAAISHNALIVQSLAKIAVVKYCSDDVYLHTSPLCHIGGISSAHAMILAGGCHVFQPKFQVLQAIEAIGQYQVTAMITVPAMLKDLTSWVSSRDQDQTNASLFTIKTILNGAGSLSSEVLQKTIKYFPAAKIFSAYGMTEACSSLSFMVLHDPNWDKNRGYNCNNLLRSVFKGKTGVNTSHHLGGSCVGKPAPHVEIITGKKYFVGSEGGFLHEEGNVLVRGPHMMEYYWGDTENAFDQDGWFDTGDVGWIDDNGNLWLLGRKKDVIKSGGENVHSSEVENILSRYPAISVAVVVGVKDARLDEKVGAMLFLEEGWRWEDDHGNDGKGSQTQLSQALDKDKVVSPDVLTLHCQQQGLSRYKVPKIWFQKTEPFNVTSTGKVRRDLVREELTACCKKQKFSQGSEFRYSKL